MFFFPLYIAHMLHTNLIPYGRCPVHILRKKEKNPLLETETGSHSGSGNHTTPGGVRFDFQAVSFEDFCHEYKRLICKQSADYLLFYFQLFCCRWLLFPPLFDDFFLRDFFFPGKEKKKMLAVEFCYGKWLCNYSFLATGKGISFAYYYYL